MYRYNRSYTGALRGAILDWAGTTVDYGCVAPAEVFVEVFLGQGVPLTIGEARAPMGMGKKDHIRAVTRMPSVAGRWRNIKGAEPTEDDVDAMYQEFAGKQLAILESYNTLIPGVLESIAAFRDRGMKIGTTTGYTREMMDIVARSAAAQGYVPDAIVSSTDVPHSRPSPAMLLQNAIMLDLYPMEEVVKIGDTVADIDEGLNAGTWVIALAQTGNELGLTQIEVAALPPEILNRRLAEISERLYRAGAHYVVNSIGDVVPVLDEIDARLKRGERP